MTSTKDSNCFAFISILCRLSLVTFNIQNFSDEIYWKYFFSTFFRWVSFPFVDIFLHEILSIEWTNCYSSWQYFVVKYYPGQNFIIKWYANFVHGRYFLWNFVSWTLFHRRQYFMIHMLYSCSACYTVVVHATQL